MERIKLINCKRTWITFDDVIYEVTRRRQRVRIAIDDGNWVIIGLKNQQVPYKANILGSIVPVEQERHGDIDYTRHISLHWGDDQSIPELHFTLQPQEVAREYDRGQFIELGVEDVSTYRVFYRDGVEASFKRLSDTRFEFFFSTGFRGSCEELDDGSYTITFKGDRLQPGEDDLKSQSKFIVSRSKLTGKLLLILQDDAVVQLN